MFDLPFSYVAGMALWLAAGSAAFVGLLRSRQRCKITRPARFRWVNLGLSLWMFLAGVTLVELYFAILYDQSDSFNMTNVSQHWFARHVQTNEAGFRDNQPFPRTVPEGQRRICFAGDSFTFGHGIKNVDDRFSDRVARRFAEARPGRFVISNIADAGVDLRLVANVVETFVEHGYQIDYLVYTICLNDIEGFDAASGETYRRFGLAAPRWFLFRDTYFFNLLYFRLQQAQLPEVRNYYSQLADTYRSAAWDAMRDKLGEFHAFCRNRNIDLRMVIFPFLHNLGADYPFDDAHQRLTEFCRESGIRVLDLKGVLLPHAPLGLTVSRFDAHPNERAHELAAEAITASLLEDLLDHGQ